MSLLFLRVLVIGIFVGPLMVCALDKYTPASFSMLCQRGIGQCHVVYYLAIRYALLISFSIFVSDIFCQ